MTRQQPRWIGRSENAHFLPFVYFACSTGKCQRCVRNEEYYFDFARSHCRWDAFKYQGRTVQKRNYSIWLHSFRLSHLHLLTLISDPWTFCLIIVLISLSRIMRVSTFSGDDMPASERELAWLFWLHSEKYSSSPHSFCCSVYIQENPSHLESVYCITNDT